MNVYFSKVLHLEFISWGGVGGGGIGRRTDGLSTQVVWAHGKTLVSEEAVFGTIT